MEDSIPSLETVDKSAPLATTIMKMYAIRLVVRLGSLWIKLIEPVSNRISTLDVLFHTTFKAKDVCKVVILDSTLMPGPESVMHAQ